MSEMKKPIGASTKSTTSANRFKRPSTVASSSSSTTMSVPQTIRKPKTKSKANVNNTVIDDANVTVAGGDFSLPEFDEGMRQIAYGKFMRAMLEDCLVDEKIKREETVMDVQLTLLAKRFAKTIDQLDKTSRRLKEVSFAVEQQRLLDLKNQDCSKFYEMIQNSKAQEVVNDIIEKDKAALDKLETKNVEFGYSEETGHKQLLDVVNEAIIGLEDIKKHSDLDPSKFKMHDLSNSKLQQLETDKLDLNVMKQEFEARFPKYSEALMKEASERIAKMMDNESLKDDDDSSSD